MKSLAIRSRMLLGSVMAGLCIGIAGTVFLSLCGVGLKALGAFLFAFGLLAILVYGFNLFTGAVGYLAIQGRNTPSYLVDLSVIWTGNLIGTAIVGFLIRNTRMFTETLDKTVSGICDDKLADGPLSMLILAFFCGILMYAAVEAYRRREAGDIFRFSLVVLCVVVFILSGFEHVIANMFYFSLAAKWDLHTFAWVGIMTLGNALGGMLIPAADKLRKVQ